jgi:hypothetical protein
MLDKPEMGRSIGSVERTRHVCCRRDESGDRAGRTRRTCMLGQVRQVGRLRRTGALRTWWWADEVGDAQFPTAETLRGVPLQRRQPEPSPNSRAGDTGSDPEV